MSAFRILGVTALLSLIAVFSIACGSDELEIRGIAPGSGMITGQEQVKLNGTGFRQGMGIDVYFGSNKAPSVVVEGSDRLVVTTPSVDDAGRVDIQIQTDQGKVLTLRNAFLFVDNQNWNLTDGFGGNKARR